MFEGMSLKDWFPFIIAVISLAFYTGIYYQKIKKFLTEIVEKSDMPAEVNQAKLFL